MNCIGKRQLSHSVLGRAARLISLPANELRNDPLVRDLNTCELEVSKKKPLES